MSRFDQGMTMKADVPDLRAATRNSVNDAIAADHFDKRLENHFQVERQ